MSEDGRAGLLGTASGRSRRGVREQTTAWHQRTNAQQRGVDWQFRIEDARVKLKSVYPKIIV